MLQWYLSQQATNLTYSSQVCEQANKQGFAYANVLLYIMVLNYGL